MSDDSASLVGVLRDGDEIRVEMTRGKESRVMNIFDSVTNQITLKLFVKGKGKEETIPTIEIDRRAKLLELRRVVGTKLNKSPDTFQLRREVRGPELKNNKKSLAAFLFRDDGRVFVDLDKCPTEMGSFTILVSVLCQDKHSNPFLETVCCVSVFDLLKFTASLTQKHSNTQVRKVESGSFLEIVEKSKEKSKEKSEENITKCTRDSTCRCELCLNSKMILPDRKAKMSTENKTKNKTRREFMMTTRLGNLKVQSNMSNEELKRAIMHKFQSKNLLPSSIEKMRLRGLDSGRRRLSKVYFDNRTCSVLFVITRANNSQTHSNTPKQVR